MLLFVTCMPCGLQFPSSPSAYPYAPYRYSVRPSSLVHPCNMAFPYPLEAASRRHYVLRVCSLPYFSIRHSTQHAVFCVPFPLTCLEHVLLFLCERTCLGVDNRTGNTQDCNKSFFISRLFTMSTNIKPRLLRLYQAISILFLVVCYLTMTASKLAGGLETHPIIIIIIIITIIIIIIIMYKTGISVYAQTCLWKLHPIT
jgi:hypothetical protein